MSYLFGLLFEYHRYQRDAVIRIYADDYLVDEISLHDHIRLKAIKYSDDHLFADNMYSAKDPHGTVTLGSDKIPHHTSVIILPKKLFLFEIDEQCLQKQIRIEVKNDNSNYTNGFMTEHSTINFHAVFLVPKYMLEKNNWIRLEHLRNYGEDHSQQDWPRQLELKDINVISSTDLWTKDFLLNPRGGNFTFEIPISKKHNVRHLGRLAPGKIWLRVKIARFLSAFKVLNTST